MRIIARPLSEQEKAEIDRRVAAHRADPSTAIPAEEFLAELERRFGCPRADPEPRTP